jgi:hypothetical protein
MKITLEAVRQFLPRNIHVLLCPMGFFLVFSLGTLSAQTLPRESRPRWVNEEGLVMAGSWEPLIFRVRRDGSPHYDPTPEQVAAWQREHSPEMIARLKDLGVNLVIIHCYKGAGLKAEKESMAEAVRFAQLIHEAGLRVGVYNYSGAFLWELFFQEMPEARDWIVLNAEGNPIPYGRALYRYYWNRNHPDAQRFYQGIVRFAVEEVKADLIYFDNYHVGPGYDAVSVNRFREYLQRQFTPQELTEMGIERVAEAQPPRGDSPAILRFAWQDYTAESLADSYHAMARYARSLRQDVLVGCNPGGVGSAIRPPVDHGRLLTAGDAYWVESGRVGYHEGRLLTRIRNYKVGQATGNITFDYTITPLEAAESLAFNPDCLGCIAWFEYAQLIAPQGSTDSVDPAILPFVQFYRRARHLFRDASPVTEVAVLRNFASQVFGGSACWQLTHAVEEELIRNRVCFQIIYDQQLAQVGRYRILVLAGCPALGDPQVEAIRKFVANGGKLCVLGPAGTHDQWLRPRSRPALEDLPPGSVLQVGNPQEVIAALRLGWGGKLAIEFADGTPVGLCAELMEQPGRRLLHLVNYRRNEPVADCQVDVALPPGKEPKQVLIFSPERSAPIPLAFSCEGNRVRFCLPQINVYEIAVIEFDEP